MRVKHLGLTDVAPHKPRTIRQQLFYLFRPERKHNFDEAGKKVRVPEQDKTYKDTDGKEKVFHEKDGFNNLVVNVKCSDGKVRETVAKFLGSQLVLSRNQKREFSKEAIDELAKLGKEKFKPGEQFHTVSNSVWPLHAPFLAALPAVKRVELPVIQPKPKYVTPSKLYSYYQCPHRIWRDANKPKEERDPPNEFLELLWEKGILHEEKIIEKLGGYLDIGEGTDEERVLKTIEAMKNGVPRIYHGLLLVDEIKGEPDLLEKQEDGTYMAVDIKAARAFEGEDGYEEGKLKEYYAMQIALYTDALMRLGFAKEKRGQILDIEGKRIDYDLNSPRGKKDKRTLWEIYLENKDKVDDLIQNRTQNDPALSSGCKLCHWMSSCEKWCTDNRHTSLVYKLGRTYSDVLREDTGIKTIDELANIDVTQLMQEKEAKGGDFLKGIAEGRLVPYVRRASYMISGAKGVKLLNPFSFPKKHRELHIDIEDDPTQGIVYMHGILEKVEGETPKYRAFVAENISPEEEKEALRKFWDYIRSLPKDYAVYHYSHHERTMYNKLREKFPDVVTQEELNEFFLSPDCIDLYKLVDQNTDWPLKSYSLKEIAKHIGFIWRDTHPSGAASIQWYSKWVQTKDPEILHRILEYNEDDCVANLVVKDYLEEKLKVETLHATSLQV